MKRATHVAAALACSGALGCSAGFGCSAGAPPAAEHDEVTYSPSLGVGLAHVDGRQALAMSGANALARSALLGRSPVAVNVPAVFNLAYDFRYSWSGGLSIAKRAIELQHGSVSLESTVGEGTRVRVRVPVQVTPGEAA